jgi:hypothetical protein
MAKKKKAQELEIAVEVIDKWGSIGEDAQYDLLTEAISSLCDQLSESGADPELTAAALFGVFMDRMSQLSDREEYEAILEEALATPWEERIVH